MIRNLKAVGLALAALLAMSAVVVSSALAQTGKITSDGPVTLKGTQTGGELENSTRVTIFGSPDTITCVGATYIGHKVATTPHGLIPNGATETTITPIYGNCHDNTGNVITVTMNGCDYVFRDATTTGGVAGTYGITTDIVCPVGKEIEMSGGPCLVKIGAQTGLIGFHLTNTAAGPNDVDLAGTVNRKATVCGISSTATWHIDVTIRGYNSEGSQTGITISD
jgi:hypothetical protein